MLKSGHILIQSNKVIFVYYEKKKPKRADYYFDVDLFIHDLEEYQASRRKVEVENEIEHISEGNAYIWVKFKIGSSLFKTKHNQPCRAKIESGIATITKILQP